METRTLESTPGFVIVDLPEAASSVGPTRIGAKLIAGNAVMYARAVTYAFAALEIPKGGATVGLRSEPAAAAAAIAALATELEADLSAQRLLTWPGSRLSGADLEPVTRHDGRSPMRDLQRDGVSFGDELVALGASVGADSQLGGLEGSTVAIEGFGPVGVALAREVEAAGGRVGRVATAAGTVSGPFTAAELAEAWTAHGEALVSELGQAGKPWEVFRGDGIDVAFIGSAPGVLSGQGAASLAGTPVVPIGPAPVSSKALAVLRKAGTPVLPDFVTTAGPILSWWPDEGASPESVRSAATATVTAVLAETADDPEGPYLGACRRAEAFMRTWVTELPFGRPLG